MIVPTIVLALRQMGFVEGWAANDIDGILAWDRPEPKPTDDELIAAGWVIPKRHEEKIAE